jgi:hypothetical protein
MTIKQMARVYSPYGIVTAAVMLPLLLPGYILTLDLVFTPHIGAPVGVSNNWLWQNLLHYLNVFVPSQIIEKAILVSIPLLASIGMHQLLSYFTDSREPRITWHWAQYIGGIFYAINPFTYSRFMAGQYAVLLGYALLPFFVKSFLLFLDKPTKKTAQTTLVIALVISVISIHTIGEMALIAVVLFGWALGRQQATDMRKTYLKWGGIMLGLFIVLSSYWLIPLVLGKGPTATSLDQFSGADAATFATVGGSKIMQLANILKLQGFWADARNLYRLPQDQLVGWGTIRLIIWILVGWGAVVGWKHRRGLTGALALIGLVSVLFALGIPQGLLTHVGYREPQKFVGVLALVFSIFLTLGSGRLLHKLKHRGETQYALAASALLIMVIIFTPTAYWGFGGQLKPRSYPASWTEANTWLNQDSTSYQVLFLPWHEYMGFGFSGRIIGNPASHFFDKPVVVSNNPELGQLGQPSNNATKLAISSWLARPSQQLSQELATYHIKYILLAKDDDYQAYAYLHKQPGLRLEWDSPELSIYRNEKVGGLQ